jgi:hypothetical protein
VLGLKVFHNRVLRKIFGPKKKKVNRRLEKVPNEELQDLYCSPNITQLIKSRRI